MKKEVPVTLTDAALTFCKECLGWSKAFPSKMANGPQVFIDRGEFAGNGERAILPYQDLAVVVEAVRDWCEANSYGWTLCSADETRRVTAIIYVECDEIERPWDGGENDEDPCQALLAACVEAKRKA